MLKLQTREAIVALVFVVAVTTWSQAQKFAVLYNFAGPPDGGVPEAALIDTHGAIYGTTFTGGSGNCTMQGYPGCGTVFRVVGDKEIVLYSFTGSPDGQSPVGALLQGTKGVLYGTTLVGGAYNAGTVFRLARKKETILHSFNTRVDGLGPLGTLVRDSAGNLYGITNNGGANGLGGTVFKLDPEGNETTLYSFCSQPNCADGEGPEGGLIMDANGNLYGTTFDTGGVFRLDPGGKLTVLYGFCPEQGYCTDGSGPTGSLVRDGSGNFYGTTRLGGGSTNPGVIFKVDNMGNETVLHTFCSLESCADGERPISGIVMDSGGNLYGTTSTGGANGGGTVFELGADGTFTVLYSFSSNGPNGPVGGLVLDAKGKIYGTASQGGPGNCTPGFSGCGAVFKVKP